MSRYLKQVFSLVLFILVAACSSSDDAAVLTDEQKCEPLKEEPAAYEQCKEQFGLE